MPRGVGGGPRPVNAREVAGKTRSRAREVVDLPLAHPTLTDARVARELDVSRDTTRGPDEPMGLCVTRTSPTPRRTDPRDGSVASLQPRPTDHASSSGEVVGPERTSPFTS